MPVEQGVAQMPEIERLSRKGADSTRPEGLPQG